MDSYFQVDAFAGQAFNGNSAGVIITESELSPETMQTIATQNNLPATAFIWLTNSEFKLRWFTMKRELPLCGHATLASAHVLFSKGFVKTNNKIHFVTGKGDLYAWFQNGWITMDFPISGFESVEIPQNLKSLFSSTFRSGFITQDRFLIELADEAAVRKFIPDINALAQYKCIVTAQADKESPYDFVSRFFDLPDGLLEDAVTGSSHCSLAPFWAARLGKKKLLAFQASSRGGELKLELDDQRVLISGQAVTVIEGKYLPLIQKALQNNLI
jgi:PhzF family phenazine biosynthesis protein